MIRLPGRPWFRPHRYGIGVSPFTWEGYAFTVCYIAGLIFLADVSGVLGSAVTEQAFARFLAAFFVLSAVYTLFAWLKTDGSWRWRWGRD